MPSFELYPGTCTPAPYQSNPIDVLVRLGDLPLPAMLDSAGSDHAGGHRPSMNRQIGGKPGDHARYDIVTADPLATVTCENQLLRVNGKPVRQSGNGPLTDLQTLIAHLLPAAAPIDHPVPFAGGGFVGYLGYSLTDGPRGPRLRPPPRCPVDLPELAGGIYNWAVVTDHIARQSCVVGPDPARSRDIVHRLSRPAPHRPGQHLAPSTDPRLLPGQIPGQSFSPGVAPGFALGKPFTCELTESAYREGFDQIQRYIRAGDCYQVNYARHFSAPTPSHPLSIYQCWRARQGAAYSAYLSLPEATILSLSPEQFLRVDNRRVTACPIKGTAPRGNNKKVDAANARELLASTKNRAENLMIVDLLRNDLGRVAVPGSVKVSAFCELLSQTNVHHLVSRITCDLPEATTTADVLAATFPCGSVTGAPKVRVMDIINELEPVGRSVYCGAVGYWQPDGNADFNVAIRSAVYQYAHIHVWGGGGIVADSTWADEFAEIQAKVGRMLTPG